MKPVRLPATATRLLPRWGLCALCILYILPGLIGRDPWKSEDAIGFGIMWTMAHGEFADWLWPNITGLTISAEGPLTYWIGAICIRIFGWLLGDPFAARISSIFFFLIGILSIWHATYLLGQRSEAQPLELAFGGQPKPNDFSRTLADGAVLIYLGCLGLLLHSHQTYSETLYVSLIALLILVCIWYIKKQDVFSTVILGCLLGSLSITRGWVIPIALWLSLLIGSKWLHLPFKKNVLCLFFALIFSIFIVGLWLTLANLNKPSNDISFNILAWMQWNIEQFQLPNVYSMQYFARYFFWFSWPAWPFAIWALFAWRKQKVPIHILLPTIFIVTISIIALSNPKPDETVLLPLLPGLSILAAFGLPTMKRGAISAVDWFSVMIFTTCSGLIWLGWIAQQTGWPTQIAKNILKLTPGFKPEFQIFVFLFALTVTFSWIFLVRWRISEHRPVLWSAVILSSGGIILCWVLLMTLWLPSINYGKSYALVAQELKQQLSTTHECINTNIGAAQRASFSYFNNFLFAKNEGVKCNFLLLQDSVKDREDIHFPNKFHTRWLLLWEGRRPSDKDERFRLYKKII